MDNLWTAKLFSVVIKNSKIQIDWETSNIYYNSSSVTEKGFRSQNTNFKIHIEWDTSDIYSKNSTVNSGNSKRLNSKKSLISKHFWWNWAIVL